MAIFTDSVMEILQRHAQGQDITTFEGLMNVGTPLFFGEEMNFISEDYREKFELGFLLKFFYKELAFDSFTAWRMAFKQKIVNNSDYINGIYATLDKQVFADYRVRRVNASGTNRIVTDIEGQSTSVTDGTVDTSISATSAETTSNRNVVDEDTTGTSSGTVAGTGTVANAKTGTETTADTGTDTVTHTGSTTTDETGTDTNAHTGTKTTSHDMMHNEQQFGSYADATIHGLTDTNTKTGTETRVLDKDTTLRKTGTETDALSGTDQRDVTLVKSGSETNQETRNLTHGESGSYRDTNHQVVDTDNDGRDNSFQVNYDSPVGSLQTMRSPGSSSAGTGSSLISNENFNYWSSGGEGGNTHIDDNTETTDGYTERTFTAYQQTDSGTDTNVLTFASRQDKTDDDVTYGKTDTKTYNTTDTGTDDETDTTTYNTTDRSVKSGTDTTTRTYTDYRNAKSDDGTIEDEYDETNTETKNLETEVTYDTTDTDTKNLQSQTTHNTTDTQTRNTLDTKSESNSGTRDVTTTDSGSKNVTDSSTQSVDTDTTVTNNNESTTTQNGTTSNLSEEIDYTYNMELLYKSMSLLDKVWDLFYDLFQIIYE